MTTFVFKQKMAGAGLRTQSFVYLLPDLGGETASQNLGFSPWGPVMLSLKKRHGAGPLTTSRGREMKSSAVCNGWRRQGPGRPDLVFAD